jgi:hypothetical protein
MRHTLPLLVGAAALAASLPAFGNQPASPDRYTATIVGEPGRATTTIQMVVERWSRDAERERLLASLVEGGPTALLDMLRDAPPVGYLRTPATARWDIRYASSTPLPDGGERVVLATDRPLTFWEQSNQTRTVDYPFTVIELRLDAQGEGEGKLSLATKIVADRQSGSIVLEDYALQPTLLHSVKREKSV